MATTLLSLFTLFVFNLLCQKSSRAGSPSILMPDTGNKVQMNIENTPATTLSQVEKNYTLSRNGFRFTSTPEIHRVSPDWEKTAPASNLFLQRPYLTAIEENPPKGLRCSYLIFYQHDTPVGVAYCQVSPFSVDSSIQGNGDHQDKYPCIVRAFGRFLKNLVVGKNHNLLVCGNLLLTGEHGYFFNPDLDKALAFEMLEEALLVIQADWEKLKVNIGAIFIKDVLEEHRAPGKILVERKFREFTFHPNMVLTVPHDWISFEDYMAAISSKYRVRAKKAFRLGEHIERRELTENQIFTYKTRLYELYQTVVHNQDFNMVTLNENYLPALKTHLGDRFRIFGYYLENELIGYYTTILNGDELEAHFLGFEPECNKTCQVYLNMLFDILRHGIEQGVHRVVYARTAMEIKSSVGAEAFEMYCYIRASNRLTNKILPPILEYLRPPDDWVPRNPFK